MENFESYLKKYNSVLKFYAKRYAYRDKKPSDHARDMYQEACIALWYAMERYDPERGVAFGTYLRIVLRSKLSNVNTTKRYGYRHTYAKFDAPERAFHIQIIEPKLGEMYKNLGDIDRKIVDQRAFEGRKAREFTEEFEYSHQWISVLRNRTLKKMRKVLEK